MPPRRDGSHHPPQMWKTALCKFWIKDKGCQKGIVCAFAHGETELQYSNDGGQYSTRRRSEMLRQALLIDQHASVSAALAQPTSHSRRRDNSNGNGDSGAGGRGGERRTPLSRNLKLDCTTAATRLQCFWRCSVVKARAMKQCKVDRICRWMGWCMKVRRWKKRILDVWDRTKPLGELHRLCRKGHSGDSARASPLQQGQSQRGYSFFFRSARRETAVRHKNDVIELLVSMGADPNIPDDHG